MIFMYKNLHLIKLYLTSYFKINNQNTLHFLFTLVEIYIMHKSALFYCDSNTFLRKSCLYFNFAFEGKR